MPTRRKTAGEQKTGRKRTAAARNTGSNGNNTGSKRKSTVTGRKKQNMRNNEEGQ